jgi:DNA segregation ATPase FtsK/SpoIIIE-like protein
VHEAGCLILDENRVAVSMLERRFRLDFDQACQVLDVLQNQGLIGPYMGGRTREILLTRDEWMSHAP